MTCTGLGREGPDKKRNEQKNYSRNKSAYERTADMGISAAGRAPSERADDLPF